MSLVFSFVNAGVIAEKNDLPLPEIALLGHPPDKIIPLRSVES
jgi:hypothetical protein